MPPKLNEQSGRHCRGVIWQGDRLIATIMPPCTATPPHNCVEFVGDECLLCVRDRLWAETAANSTALGA